MPNEKDVNWNNQDELRKAIAEYARSQEPPRPQHPLMPGSTEYRDDAGKPLSAEKLEAVAIGYGRKALDTPAGQLSKEQRDFLEAGVRAWAADPQ
jgi:hypothetical protein